MSIDEFEQRKVTRGYVWLKLFTDLLDDPKFMRLTDQAKAVYFEVYLLAGKSDASGLVTVSDKPATVQDIAWILRRSESDLDRALFELSDADLVELNPGLIVDDQYQTTIKRFTKEQGPSMTEKREQWAKDQRRSRARAKGEKLPDADEPNADEHEKQNKKQEKQTEQDIKTQTKRVSSMSDNSQISVRTDNSGGGGLIDSGLVLSVWHDMTGLEFKPGKTFDAMIKDWQGAGVTIQNVRDAITQANGEANTPLYLAISAKNLHKKETAQARSGGGMSLETARQLRMQNKAGSGLDEILAGAPIFEEDKQAGGDNGMLIDAG